MSMVTVLLDAHGSDVASPTEAKELFQLRLSPALGVLGVGKAADLVLVPAGMEASVSVVPVVHTMEAGVRMAE